MRYLVVVDLQKEFIKDGYSTNIYNNCINYINHNRGEYDKVIALVFRNNPIENPNFCDSLGYFKCIKPKALEFDADYIIQHCGYGSYDLEVRKDDSYDVIGFDTDACVLATCFRIFDCGGKLSILKDYCWSSGGATMHDAGLSIIKRQFGTCVK